MMKKAIFCILFMLPMATLADVVVANKTIRANSIIEQQDVEMRSISNGGAYSRTTDVIGQEARVTLYAGRPILFDNVGPPALVNRNQIVSIRFESNGLIIMTEGRSLQRGGLGDRIRIMNLDSRTTLFGQIQADGSVRVFN